MKTHSQEFKENISKLGRQLKSRITYTLNNEEIELGNPELNSVTLSYETSLLKSVMKYIEIDSNVEIPTGTIFKYELGLKTGNEYEYLNYGNYVVKEVEIKEDTNSYLIKAYDKMLYAMKDYESFNTTYPITIRDYISALCNYLGLTFANAEDEFANYDKEIPNELFLNTDNKSIGYTFRDALDQLAEATASNIVINKDDEVEIRYISNSNDTIDEKYFKNINVKFGEKYGPVNSIVLTRAGESDSVYLQDEESVEENGLCELKISENQIMNGNDRSDYLQDILDQLDGLEYYINDFDSTGICYYDVCDRYGVQIGQNTYDCIMFNDSIEITQGLEENIYTEIPKTAETDYTKADKTDRKINQTTIIVDKHEQEIQALITKVVDISDVAEGIGEINLENAYEGELYSLEIRGNVSLTFPNKETLYGEPVIISDNLIVNDNQYISSGIPYTNKDAIYPSNALYPKNTYLQVDETLYKLDFDYLNYINESTYDKYILKNGSQWIERNVGIDSNGQLYKLENTVIETKPDLYISVKENSNIKLLSFANAILKSEYLLENNYTETFATQAFVKSEIKQTADDIELQVNAKVDEDEIIAKLNVAIEDGQGIIKLMGNTVTIDSDNFQLDETGKIEATAGDIAGFEMNGEKGFIKKVYTEYDYTNADATRLQNILLGTITPTEDDYKKYDFNEDGTLNSADLLMLNFILLNGISTTKPITFLIEAPETIKKLNELKVGYIDPNGNYISGFGIYGSTFGSVNLKDSRTPNTTTSMTNSSIKLNHSGTDKITLTNETGNITCVSLTQTSKEENKKNFEKLKNAKEILKNTDIYKYNFKDENDDDKKSIGFVIGDKYNYSKEITSAENDGANIYSMVSVLWQVVKEQQEEIEKIQKEIKLLKEEKDDKD